MIILQYHKDIILFQTSDDDDSCAVPGEIYDSTSEACVCGSNRGCASAGMDLYYRLFYR